MTVHGAKGLEFPVVFVVGLEEELFPMGGRNGEEADFEEERRLFYVAITRAKRELYFSHAKQRSRFGERKSMKRSRFLDEVDSAVVRTEAGATIRQGGQEIRRGFGSSRGERRRGARSGQSDGQSAGASQPSRPAPPPKASYEGTTYDVQSAADLSPGVQVFHERFGVGKIIGREGAGQNMKVTVFFKDYGQKKLMVRMAGLKIIK
jgi:DNA helicase-2/ATP-dependent DNA helicase PcrA